MSDMYEREWREVSHKYFEDTPWPTPYTIHDLTRGSDVFMTMYSLLYHRHILYSLPHVTKKSATAEQYIDAWPAYIDFFNLVLDSDADELPAIPALWLYDTLSDFQDHFTKFQNKVRFADPDSDVDGDGDAGAPASYVDEKAWHIEEVLRYFSITIEESGINERLARGSKPSGVLQLCGYFSLVNLCRMHAKMGDYSEALRVVEQLNLRSDASVFAGVVKCHVTLFYYIGFSLLMTRRFADALAGFSRILLILHRTRQSLLSDPQSPGGFIKRKADQMLALLAVCVALCPGQRVDELVMRDLKDKYDEHIARMKASNSLEDFEDLYRRGCPKFMAPTFSEDASPTTFQHHLMLFRAEIQQRLHLMPATRSYLQLYTNIDIPKLARFCATDERTMLQSLVSLKMKSYQRPLPGTFLSDAMPVGGSGTAGAGAGAGAGAAAAAAVTAASSGDAGAVVDDSAGFRSTDSLHFYADDNVVHVEEHEVADTSEEHFIRQIGALHALARKASKAPDSGGGGGGSRRS